MYLHMAVRAMLHRHYGYYWIVSLSNLSVCACALLNEILCANSMVKASRNENLKHKTNSTLIIFIVCVYRHYLTSTHISLCTMGLLAGFTREAKYKTSISQPGDDIFFPVRLFGFNAYQIFSGCLLSNAEILEKFVCFKLFISSNIYSLCLVWLFCKGIFILCLTL